MAKQTKESTGPIGCLLLVVVTAGAVFLIHMAGFPKATEKRLLGEAFTPLAMLFGMAGLLLIAAVFRR